MFLYEEEFIMKGSNQWEYGSSTFFQCLCMHVDVQFFRRFHSAYVDAACNPFHVPGKRISSPAFAERVSTIVKSFGTNPNA